jgi:two-component sensor histidine kinase
MRRVSSIALVHETLSVSMDERVDFDEVVDRLLVMLSDVMGSSGRIVARRSGSFGEVPAESATTLVLVLTELVQNAVEHAFPDGAAGHVYVEARRSRDRLAVTVRDDGVGLPTGFESQVADRLGLQIVRTLVAAELGGSVEFRPARLPATDGVGDGPAQGTAAVVSMDLGRRSRNAD